MLTRLEVSGFKNTRDLAVDFGPYTCIAGPNGSGKSNLFDAIAFLGALADLPIMEAARKVRGEGRRQADVRDLFLDRGEAFRHPLDPAVSRSMRFGAELLVPKDVTDDFGRTAEATTTFLRYELELGYVPPSDAARFGQVRLLHESLTYIKKGEAHRHLRFPHAARSFREKVVLGERRAGPFISTDALTIRVHQVGGSRGQPKPSSAASAQRTIVGTTTTTADPTILACRRELQSWRQLALEPAAMREPSELGDAARLAPNGARLAATLYRLAHPLGKVDNDDEHAQTLYAQIAARLSQLVGVRGLRVDRDDARELLTLVAEEAGVELSARSLSDGTLRFLALCVLDADAEATGLICMEEPENGIHPARLPAMADLVRSIAVDAEQEPGPQNPLRQVIVNTHSPGFVRLQPDDDLLIADRARVRNESGRPSRVLSLSACSGSWRDRAGTASAPRAVIQNLLSDGPGQLSLVGSA
jgi:predicted ATPase